MLLSIKFQHEHIQNTVETEGAPPKMDHILFANDMIKPREATLFYCFTVSPVFKSVCMCTCMHTHTIHMCVSLNAGMFVWSENKQAVAHLG